MHCVEAVPEQVRQEGSQQVLPLKVSVDGQVKQLVRSDPLQVLHSELQHNCVEESDGFV